MLQDRFWPYQRQSANTEVASTYMAAIKRVFLGHACVVSAFTPADEKLARDWERRGIPVETVQRAILLSVARKYTTCLNHGVGAPIVSLEYFAGVLAEIQDLPASPDYWTYVARKVQALQTAYPRRTSAPTMEPVETK